MMEAKIQKLIDLLQKNQITSLKYKDDKCEIVVKNEHLSAPLNNVINPPQSPLETETINHDQQDGTMVKAPIVGTFYQAPAVGQKAFVKVNQKVVTGQTLCILEAMKVMNEIKAPCDGIIKKIMVKNEDLVEFDQVLMIIG